MVPQTLQLEFYSPAASANFFCFYWSGFPGTRMQQQNRQVGFYYSEYFTHD